MKRLALRVGEYYAIKPSAIERDADGFFVVAGDPVPPNEARGTVGVVHVRGALSQFAGDGGDSYEAIAERVAQALASDPKPTSVALCISSPGGVVAGLNECVFKLQRMSAAAKIPLVACINELAASAAMALACACAKRFAPKSAIAGSIGTISTMVSCSEADKANGLDFRIITSGKRKADGHPHQPIEDDAVKAEKARNAELAEQFFALASKALGVSAAKLEDLEAAIFVGENARRAGLVDKIMSLDEALAGLDRSDTGVPEAAANTGNITDRRAKELDTPAHSGTDLARTAQSGSKSQPGTPREGSMKPKLQAFITKTESALATETDSAKRRVLEATLGAAMVRAEMDDDEPPKKGDDDDDDDSKAKKAEEKAKMAKKAEEKAKIKSKRADAKAKHEKLMAELDDEEARCEEDDEEAKGHGEEEKASLSAGAAAALSSQADLAAEAIERIEKLEREATARELSTSIDAALVARRIAKHEAKDLRSRSADFVREYLAMRPKPVVFTEDSAAMVPSIDAKGNTVLPEDLRKAVDEAMMVAGEGKSPEQREAIRKSMVDAHVKRMNGAAAGRY